MDPFVYFCICKIRNEKAEVITDMQKYKNSWDNYRQVYADKMDNLGEKQQQQIPRNVQSPKIEQERIF